MKKHHLKTLKSVEKIVEELKNYDELLESNIDEFFDGMYKINLSRQDINQHKIHYREKQKKLWILH